NRPLIDLKRLNKRLNLVSDFLKQKQALKEIRKELDNWIDVERILGKVSRGKATPRDVMNMQASLIRIPFMREILEKNEPEYLGELASKFPELNTLTQFLRDNINEQAPLQIKKGAVIKAGIDIELDELRELSSGGKEWMVELQASERKRTGIPSLKIGYNRVFGYYLEITRTHHEKVPQDYILKQTLVNTERFITPELKEYEEKILSADEKIEIIETRIFNEICREIIKYSLIIQKSAALVSRIDLLSTFSVLALENHYCKPELSSDPILEIKSGRHPVVEKLLSATDRFIPNDLKMDTRVNQIHLITGPNMAGKSTYLRQTGLIVLMAQIGSFVPARSALIGIVDKLFTRVGASDNLAGGESTFLVEMNEAANILNNASAESLILLDEIGRGTATYDGMALAWAITEYLHDQPQISARTIFATHYHELTDLENTLDRLENHHIAVKEFGDKIVFLRKIMNGPGDKSYGIHVAKMAGLPNKVVDRAAEILNYHLQNENTKESEEHGGIHQISIFEQQESEMKKDLAKVEIDKITPLEALFKLDELKKKHGI
ncbi:MAG: DNA mismatch repair protein MutS, partial [Candidatus Neomarinimicrobiota bacterium]